MCHLSPTVHLAWAVLTCGLLVFLIQHLWRYDRFQCLAWSGERQPGTFKRVMTYSYIISVPLLTVYTVSMTVLKYRYGYRLVPGEGIVPTPFQFWDESDRVWLQPLYIVFGIVWGLEIVTHLEELMFWLFLIHQGPVTRYWFASSEFRIWIIGSCMAMVGLPLTAILTRANPLKTEAYLFLVGSLASFTITALFFGVLVEFPKFLDTVQKEGAATPVILRLVEFHELNIARIIFRLFMTVPLLVLGIDGVRDHVIINENQFWTDLLAFLTAVGTVVSSSMTLLIFFPRSLVKDSNRRFSSIERRTHYSLISRVSPISDRHHQKFFLAMKPNQTSFSRHSKQSFDYDYRELDKLQIHTADGLVSLRKLKHYRWMEEVSSTAPIPSYPAKTFFVDNHPSPDDSDYKKQQLTESVDRKATVLDSDEENDFSDLKIRLMELGQIIDSGLRQPTRPPRLHPYITSYISPIDLQGDELVPRAI